MQLEAEITPLQGKQKGVQEAWQELEAARQEMEQSAKRFGPIEAVNSWLGKKSSKYQGLPQGRELEANLGHSRREKSHPKGRGVVSPQPVQGGARRRARELILGSNWSRIQFPVVHTTGVMGPSVLHINS